MSKVVIVDENDEAIGVKERDSLTPTDMYRISFLWMTNSKGEVLLAKRSAQKKMNPGVWGPAAAGTVEEGESYDTNIVKEIGEELGLQIALEDLEKGPKMSVARGEKHWFAQSYFLTRDVLPADLVLQEEEVERAQWFSVDEIRRMIRETPELVTYSSYQWEAFLSRA